MALYSSESFWAIARLWYTLSALIIFSLLGNAWQENDFGKLFKLLGSIPPAVWLIIAAVLAPGPLAHWLSRRVKP